MSDSQLTAPYKLDDDNDVFFSFSSVFLLLLPSRELIVIREQDNSRTQNHSVCVCVCVCVCVDVFVNFYKVSSFSMFLKRNV